MTPKQIKTEIQKVLDTIPEDTLQSILDYLNSIKNQSADSISLSHNIRKILSEDKELLERLAR